MAAAAPGALVVVSQPNAVLVDMTDIPTSKWNKSAMGLSPDGDRALIPLPACPPARNTKKGEDVGYFRYSLGFSYTFYKLQGLTMEQVILDLRSPPNGEGKNFRAVAFGMLYVGLTRVRSGADIRVLINVKGKTRLKRLRDDGILGRWLARYNSDGLFI